MDTENIGFISSRCLVKIFRPDDNGEPILHSSRTYYNTEEDRQEMARESLLNTEAWKRHNELRRENDPTPKKGRPRK